MESSSQALLDLSHDLWTKRRKFIYIKKHATILWPWIIYFASVSHCSDLEKEEQ